MVAMARQRSLPELLGEITSSLAKCERVVLARIWLIDAGDICNTCRFLAECPDRTRCLHLVSSAGNSIDKKADSRRLSGAFRRFPLGVRKIGQVAMTGEPLLLSRAKGSEEWIADPSWWKREGIQSFAAQPLVSRDETLGVIAVFDRSALEANDFDWLRVFADHAAVSISNARAFQEIESLRTRLEDENAYLREEVTSALGVGSIIGESPGLQKVMQQIALVAETEATVLIAGESGTGKELIARAIHDHSPRKGRSLIAVNCSAVPESLFESEFFGHVKGAFTGAIQDRPGRFELADGGTLFLDEIGDVPLAMQAKLLRVLQEREVERIGDTRTRQINVRVIAATHRDLKKDVESGRFRKDLFYRLSVFPIDVPPLRERGEDIAPLAMHFVRQGALRMNRPVPRLTQAAVSQLLAHDWPGNVRELQNVVERAIILSRGGPLHFELAGPALAAAPPRPSPVESGLLTRVELKRRERDSLGAALEQSGGKIFGPGGAAELLGMRPTTLASRIKALGLTRKTGRR